MKKVFSLILAAAMVLSLASCAVSSAEGGPSSSSGGTVTVTGQDALGASPP